MKRSTALLAILAAAAGTMAGSWAVARRGGRLGDTTGNVGQSTVCGPRPETTLRGISVSTLTPDIANQLKLPSNTKGVVVTNVDSASPAAEAGLQDGDVIQEVNHQPVSGVDGFNRAMQSAGNQPVVLLVDRNGTTSFVVVQSQ
jgi:S1-C subfamily serine protease